MKIYSMLVLAILLTGCDDAQVAHMSNALNNGAVQSAAASIACDGQKLLELKADIATRGTELLVTTTGVMSEAEIAQGKAQFAPMKDAAIQTLQAEADKHGVNCESVGRGVIEQAANVLR